MSVILAIETATNSCSVALLHGGEICTQQVVAPREHAERVLGMIDAVMAESSTALSQLDAIAFGQGPGSFLGTRIAAGVAQGLGYSLGRPLLPVSSLAALAQQAYEVLGTETVLAAWDARLQAFYWGSYQLEGSVMMATKPDALAVADQWRESITDSTGLVGNAWKVYQASFPETFQSVIGKTDARGLDYYPEAHYLLAQAALMLEQGDTVLPADAEPIYLRDPV